MDFKRNKSVAGGGGTPKKKKKKEKKKKKKNKNKNKDKNNNKTEGWFPFSRDQIRPDCKPSAIFVTLGMWKLKKPTDQKKAAFVRNPPSKKNTLSAEQVENGMYVDVSMKKTIWHTMLVCKAESWRTHWSNYTIRPTQVWQKKKGYFRDVVREMSIPLALERLKHVAFLSEEEEEEEEELALDDEEKQNDGGETGEEATKLKIATTNENVRAMGTIINNPNPADSNTDQNRGLALDGEEEKKRNDATKLLEELKIAATNENVRAMGTIINNPNPADNNTDQNRLLEIYKRIYDKEEDLDDAFDDIQQLSVQDDDDKALQKLIKNIIRREQILRGRAGLSLLPRIQSAAVTSVQQPDVRLLPGSNAPLGGGSMEDLDQQYVFSDYDDDDE